MTTSIQTIILFNLFDIDSYFNFIFQVDKNLSVDSLITGGDRFKVKVYPNVDCAFIVALIVILDEITSQAKRSSNNKEKR